MAARRQEANTSHSGCAHVATELGFTCNAYSRVRRTVAAQCLTLCATHIWLPRQSYPPHNSSLFNIISCFLMMYSKCMCACKPRCQEHLCSQMHSSRTTLLLQSLHRAIHLADTSSKLEARSYNDNLCTASMTAPTGQQPQDLLLCCAATLHGYPTTHARPVIDSHTTVLCCRCNLSRLQNRASCCRVLPRVTGRWASARTLVMCTASHTRVSAATLRWRGSTQMMLPCALHMCVCAYFHACISH